MAFLILSANNYICLLSGVPVKEKLNLFLGSFLLQMEEKTWDVEAAPSSAASSSLPLQATAPTRAITNTTEWVTQTPSGKEPEDDSASQGGRAQLRAIKRHMAVCLLQLQALLLATLGQCSPSLPRGPDWRPAVAEHHRRLSWESVTRSSFYFI